jgi:hypothetical protein
VIVPPHEPSSETVIPEAVPVPLGAGAEVAEPAAVDTGSAAEVEVASAVEAVEGSITIEKTEADDAVPVASGEVVDVTVRSVDCPAAADVADWTVPEPDGGPDGAGPCPPPIPFTAAQVPTYDPELSS